MAEASRKYRPDPTPAETCQPEIPTNAFATSDALWADTAASARGQDPGADYAEYASYPAKFDQH